MSDNLIPEVGNLSLDLVIRIQAQSQQQQQPAPKRAEKAENAVEAAAQRQEKTLAALDVKAQQEARPDRGMVSLADVSLKFMINADTKDVTILILDRASRKVVRTIPPEDMNRMDPGELLQLFA
ncbi:MAG: flagellar protein FlaG [Chloroflexi bacterium]|nr:flagellar protein FlaG [Chloroflexota bacterium]